MFEYGFRLDRNHVTHNYFRTFSHFFSLIDDRDYFPAIFPHA